MGRFELIPFESPEALAQAAAERWMAQIPVRDQFIALSGGRISQNLFQAAARLAGRKLERTHFFWADERCVPPNDPESNYGIAKRLLLAPLEIPEERIHRIRGEAPPTPAALEAEAELARIAPMNEEGCPLLDVVFLGMGEDGHIASLFPSESEEARQSKALYRPVIAPKPPPQRITISYGMLAAAREAWVLISGTGKEQALQNSIGAGSTTPLGRLIARRERTMLMLSLVPAHSVSRIV